MPASIDSASGRIDSKSTRQKRPGFSRPLWSEKKRSSKRVRASSASGASPSGSSRWYNPRVDETSGACALGNGSGLLANLIVSLAFDEVRQVVAARFHDAAVYHHVHDIGCDLLQDARIVRNDEEAGVAPLAAGAQRRDRVADVLERVDVEPGVGLVEDRILGRQHGELQHLEPLFLAARKTVVQIAAHERGVDPELLHLLEEQRAELRGRKIARPFGLARRVEEVGYLHPRDRGGILKG